MPGFDPDAYLAKKSGGFDPDAYLAQKAPAAPVKPSAAPAKDEGIDVSAVPGAGLMDAGLSMVRSAVAKPVADIAGLAAQGYDYATGAHEGNAEGFKNEVQSRIAGQPFTKQGRQLTEAAALPGKAVDYAGKVLEDIIGGGEGASTGRRMVGAGVHEAVNQAPQLLGMKGPAMADRAGAALKQGARDTMQSALKPPIADLKKGNAGKAIDTMLDEGINVSKGGLEKVRGKIDSLNDQIATQVQNSPKVIDKRTVLMRLNQVFKDFENQVNPTSDIVAIQKAYDDFDKHPLLTGNKIPVSKAQELKQGTYKSLGNKAYGELKGADIEAQKALARGLKEKIAQALPEVRKLNAEESKLLNTLPLIERRVLMDANKNPIGVGWLTTNPAKMAGFMADRSPLFKSLVARMLNQGSKAAPSVGKLAPLGGAVTTTGAGMIPPPPEQAASAP